MVSSTVTGFTSSNGAHGAVHRDCRPRDPGRLGWWACALLLLAGCSTVPEPVTEQTMVTLIEDDRALIVEQRLPVSGAISQSEAIARALKFNLDHRVTLLEQAYATARFEAGRYDLLPQVLANAGYSTRDEEAIRDSIDSVTGAPSLSNPSISSERERATANLGLTWSLLDFGVGYYNARQNANALLIASERRRQAMYHLIERVRATYWKAAAAQVLAARVRDTQALAEQALTRSRSLSSGGVTNPVESLRYQRNLLENLRLLESVQRELAQGSIELASLMGLDPGTAFELSVPTGLNVEWQDLPLGELEVRALVSNPDLRAQVYNTRNAALETRRAMLGMFPNLSFDTTLRYDDDRYLINNQWQEAGARIGFNLLGLLSTPARMRASEASLHIEEARRMALQMAVLTQLHMAYNDYGDAIREYRRAVMIAEVDAALGDIAIGQEASRMSGRLERISADVSVILSTLRQYRALARVHEQSSRVHALIGSGPEIDSVDTLSVSALSALIEPLVDEWPLP